MPVRYVAVGSSRARGVAEWDYQVHHHRTDLRMRQHPGAAYPRDGLIVHSRDFHDHLALIVGGGGLPQVVTALEGE
ncbi:hypothetical protein ACFZA1_39430 [Streptomyces filipinensis]|uniref:hypothetical protein n=1 Tax=Streptomyces filipinensis TaxID=66887 RepID=UPI0036E5B2F2